MKYLPDSTRCLLSLALLCSLLSGCDGTPGAIEVSGETMGTTYTVKVVGTALDADVLKTSIDNRLIALNDVFSTYIPGSELSRLNQDQSTADIPVSSELMSVLRMSQEIFDLSSGAFDVTVGPLVNLWGFGADGPAAGVPPAAVIEQMVSAVGYDKVELGDAALSRPAGLQIDLSAIAKGYAVDQLARLLEDAGALRYMVEIGGEVRARGLNSRATAWIIGIETPDRDVRRLHRTLPVRDLGMATSGDYRNYFEFEGAYYAHTIDPRTGWPVTHRLASVTVLHRSAAMADGLATAFTVLGPDIGMKLAEAQKLRILAIIRTGDAERPYEELLSTEMKRYLGDG